MSPTTETGTRAEDPASTAPKRLLALDGGGIRGVLTLQILGKIEALLAQATGRGPAFRLCEFFDYVAGTSTGAIIAAGLARGMSVADIHEFYARTGPAMFEPSSLLSRLKSLYASEPLARELQGVFGTAPLGSSGLRSLLLVVTRNVTTDSPWPISSNPRAKYNDPARPDSNLRIPLWKLVRASTAAPIYFPPEVVNLDPADPSKSFLFVDGGMTPYNNPAFLLYRMATLPTYRLGWPTGERNLLLISVGTGSAAQLSTESGGSYHWTTLAGIPTALMYGALVDQDINCRTVGRCVHGAPIDREIGDLIPRDDQGGIIPLEQDLGRAFLYARYNADLSRKGLDDLGLPALAPAAIQRLDLASAENIRDLGEVGRRAAEQVRLEHFRPFIPA
jgi:uncharacterized protein